MALFIKKKDIKKRRTWQVLVPTKPNSNHGLKEEERLTWRTWLVLARRSLSPVRSFAATVVEPRPTGNVFAW